ncbi:MAG: uracil-DNA glycosylase [bacterium]|nr:uracil-DNA glycosylase [bacterium]
MTWDRNFPYGCKAMGFKARTQPSIEVFNSSGIECQMFTMKEKGDG